MKFQILDCKSISDLLNQIKEYSKSLGEIETPKEIERKWLMRNDFNYIIEYLTSKFSPCVKHIEILQGYISVNPEIRYRSSRDIETSNINYYIAYKSDGDLVRDEIELPITLKSAFSFGRKISTNKKIKEINGSKFIVKDYYVFDIDGIRLQISQVDNNPNFIYSEIEFATEEDAENFKIPESISHLFVKEVTDNSNYKMKNYWKRTRLK